MKIPYTKRPYRHGFALVVTLSLMVLLTLIAVGLLTLSAISTRSTANGSAQAEAQANARLALMLAIGELQKEMGPDMRVSAESAIFDTDQSTEDIDGVAQSHWLASYNSWGDWLNNTYTPPGTSSSLTIQDTYAPRREKMFRRWLLSLPKGMETDPKAPLSSVFNDSNSVVLVGTGSLGNTLATAKPDQVARAYLTSIGTRGKNAWWVSPENQKAKINMAKRPRTLSNDQWEVAQGDTAEIGVGSLSGFSQLDTDSTLSTKLISTNTLRQATVEKEKLDENFYNITSVGQGVIASVRGTFKKDLSLLFEMDANKLSAPYKFTIGTDTREPSIRPMSPELASKPQLPNRLFQSWTNMRHYYRLYRASNDATIGGMNGPGILDWQGSKPSTSIVSATSMGKAGTASGTDWDGSNNYWRVPILAKITFIYSLIAERHPTQAGKYNCYHVYSPVFTLWNPYNVEMKVPNDTIEFLTSAYKAWPNTGEFWLGGTRSKTTDDLGAFGQFGYSQSVITKCKLNSSNGAPILFNPGEFRVFSLASNVTGSADSAVAKLVPGFDPQAVGGEKKLYGIYSIADNPGIRVMFSHNYWGGNINGGNTCGSLSMPGSVPGGQMPLNYAVDWLNKSQRLTPMTPPGTANIARWVFDGKPVPVAFCQLVIKGMSEFTYESIGPKNTAPFNWAKDWRCRNWIQSPPFYFGSGMYISENDTIAHTQRVDSPYVIFFGPTSMAEIPKVVPQVGPLAYLGSGSNPFERVTAAPALELPTAPISSIAGFSGMRINPVGPVRTRSVSITTTSKYFSHKLTVAVALKARAKSPFIMRIPSVSTIRAV